MTGMIRDVNSTAVRKVLAGTEKICCWKPFENS